MRLRTPVEAVCIAGPLHNGSISRDSLPLRNRGKRRMQLKTPVVAVCVSGTFHNGSISRNSVPLRNRGKR